MNIFAEILQVKKPEKDLVESLLSAYESLAKARGFEVRREGKALFFKGERISALLRIEFGGRRDFFETITYMNAAPAEYKVLVASSNARALPMEAAYTVLKKKLLVKEKWMLVDIEGKKPPMFINWGGPFSGSRAPAAHPPQRGRQARTERRKMIYGAPGERKEQD